MAKESIEELFKTAILGDWKLPIDEDCYYSALAITFYLIAKNGKKYLANIYCNMTFPKKDYHKYTIKEINDIQRLKLENAKRTIIHMIERKLDGRQGLKFHRGYFDFQGVEAY